jgi:hypothetical protein
LDGASDEMYDYDSPFEDDCLGDIDEDPLSARIPVGPELGKLGIQDMILFEKNLIFETKDGIVFLTIRKDESQFYIRPLKKPWRKHSSILKTTIFSLLNSKEFRYSTRDRMNGV